MEDFDEEFLMTFNEFYPFEKYIIKNPKRINDDGALLTEIFVQKTKTDTDLDSDENFLCRKYSDTNFYIKVKGDAGEMRFSYFDFAPHIREEIRLWTIQDAKNGDVLASNCSVFILRKLDTAGKPIAYCGIVEGVFYEASGYCWTEGQCYPATEEQRDLLDQKMKKAGCCLDDFEKL